MHTSDVDHFWQAYDSVSLETDQERKIALMQKLYIDKGTVGLKAFMELRNFDVESMVTSIQKYPKFWKSVRPNTLSIGNKGIEIDEHIQKFNKLYPNYRAADIYFTITPVKSGGTTKDSLVLIGTEIATGNAMTDVSEFPDKRLETFFKSQTENNIVPFCIHEYVHTQQLTEGLTLLGQSIYEGTCDFITELILGNDLNHSYLVYGKVHEDELKEKFKEEMFSEDWSNWLYNGNKAETVGDLGYFMGYAISKAYFEKAADKDVAIAQMIELNYKDLNAVTDFLDQSGYYQP